MADELNEETFAKMVQQLVNMLESEKAALTKKPTKLLLIPEDEHDTNALTAIMRRLA